MAACFVAVDSGGGVLHAQPSLPPPPPRPCGAPKPPASASPTSLVASILQTSPCWEQPNVTHAGAGTGGTPRGRSRAGLLSSGNSVRAPGSANRQICSAFIPNPSFQRCFRPPPPVDGPLLHPPPRETPFRRQRTRQTHTVGKATLLEPRPRGRDWRGPGSVLSSHLVPMSRMTSAFHQPQHPPHCEQDAKLWRCAKENQIQGCPVALPPPPRPCPSNGK